MFTQGRIEPKEGSVSADRGQGEEGRERKQAAGTAYTRTKRRGGRERGTACREEITARRGGSLKRAGTRKRE